MMSHFLNIEDERLSKQFQANGCDLSILKSPIRVLISAYEFFKVAVL